MRLNNANKSGLFSFLSTLILMAVLGCIAVFVLERYGIHFFGFKGWFFLLAAIVLLLIFYLRGRPFFAYDSDGEALNFKNRHIYPFLARSANDEFPKYKLQNFDIVDALIFRRLYITLSSKKSSALVLKYDISYLSRKEVTDLKISLNKVVKANKENK